MTCCWGGLLSQDALNPFQRPIDFIAGDGQGWGKANGVFVGFLAQDAQFLQFKTVAPRTACVQVKFHGEHQAAPTYIPDGVIAYLLKAFQKIRALFGGIFNHALFDQNL